jgi:hypothetical protein
MAACCSGGDTTSSSQKVALRDSRRYRRKGLDSTGRRIVGFAAQRDRGRDAGDAGAGVGSLAWLLAGAGGSPDRAVAGLRRAQRTRRDAGVSIGSSAGSSTSSRRRSVMADVVVSMRRRCYPDHESPSAPPLSAGRLVATWAVDVVDRRARLPPTCSRARRAAARTSIRPRRRSRTPSGACGSRTRFSGGSRASARSLRAAAGIPWPYGGRGSRDIGAQKLRADFPILQQEISGSRSRTSTPP